MPLPELTAITQSRSVLQEFKGYNHNLRINEGEWFDMMNMSCDTYPVMTERKKRGKVRTFKNFNGIFTKNGVVYVDGTSLYYKEKKVGTVSDTRKTFCGMGAYVVIWPDKVYFNTNDEVPVLKGLGAEKVTTGEVTYTPCTLDGTAVSEEHYKKSTEDPYGGSAANGDYWLDISTSPAVLKMWQSSTSQWTSVPTSYIRIENTGIGEEFNQYDVVNISGSIHNEFNMDMCIWNKGTDYLVVIALPASTESQTTSLTLERKVPDMDFVCENNNRIWGCSSKNHEIYCSKQGDPTNWYSYLGNANDSYAATIGSDGDFTGCIAHLSYVLFFKENLIHKVYGTMPSNYQITQVSCRGVQKGSERSLKIVNETLFYKSEDGICVYEGGLPASISYCLGEEHYKNAVAGVVTGKYYVSMQDSKDRYSMFVYDISKQIWTKEDNVQVLDFVRYNNSLYFVDANKNLWCVDGKKGEKESEIEWFVESGEIGLSTPDMKYISKLAIRLDIEYGGEVHVDTMYDSSGEWKEEFKLESRIMHSKRAIPSFTKLRSYSVPLIPRRCDHVKIRLRGKGRCKLYSLTETMQKGSDIS